VEILTQLLRPEHREAGLHLEEDVHIIYLKRGDEVLGRWSATGATMSSIWDEADKYSKECPSNQ